MADIASLVPQAALEHEEATRPTSAKWANVAASRRVDLLWQHLDGIPGRVEDIKIYYGALNGQMMVGQSVDDWVGLNASLIQAQDRMTGYASRNLAYSGVLLVPSVNQSLHFGGSHGQVWSLTREVFEDDEVWKQLIDQENSRRTRLKEPSRPGKLLRVDYVRVDVSALHPSPDVAACGEFLGIRLRMTPPSSAARAACTGSMVLRLRRKKKDGLSPDRCPYFAFRTPPEARDMPINIVIYHNQARMEKDAPSFTWPLPPVEGVVLVKGEDGEVYKKWVAYYDLLWLYSCASYDQTFFKFEPEAIAETFSRLTGPQDRADVWNATVDVVFQRLKKAEHRSKVWRPYVARRRSYRFRNLVHENVAVPAAVVQGPSYVAPKPQAVSSDLISDVLLADLRNSAFFANFDTDLFLKDLETETPA